LVFPSAAALVALVAGDPGTATIASGLALTSRGAVELPLDMPPVGRESAVVTALGVRSARWSG